MEPNKFERHIKEQMQKREIQPSGGAWEKVSERLEPSIEGKNNKFLWYSAAASFIGIMIVSILFFQSDDPSVETEVQIVDSKEEIIEDVINENINNEAIVKEDALVENDGIEQFPITKSEVPVGNKSDGLSNQIAAVKEAASDIDLTVEKMGNPNDFKEEIIQTKILEIVAAVDSLEQNNDALTEAEVDELLRNAQDEILREKILNQSGSVDAMALLTEVEDELDKSFRDQIFESLKTGFLKVRTAVADRNK